jgi:hypothetical protein
MTNGSSKRKRGKEMSVSGVSLGKWKRGAIGHGDHPDPNYKGPNIDCHFLQEENLRLKQENEVLGQQREILKKSLGPSLETILVKETLPRGLADRRPAAGLLHHSERGIQYASSAFQARRAFLENYPRLHSAPGFKSPAAFEQQLTPKNN